MQKLILNHPFLQELLHYLVRLDSVGQAGVVCLFVSCWAQYERGLRLKKGRFCLEFRHHLIGKTTLMMDVFTHLIASIANDTNIYTVSDINPCRVMKLITSNDL